MYEGVDVYYSNFYGYSDYHTIIKVAEFLQDSEYMAVAEKYILGIADCERYNYPIEKQGIAREIDVWINHNTKPVWDFYVDILEHYKHEIQSK